MLHIDLIERIEAAYGASHLTAITLCRDAIEVYLSNGVELNLRMASPDEYCMRWRWGEAIMCIDTAPLHKALGTFPNHLHRSDGEAVDDPVTEIGSDPWRNVSALIDRLVLEPLLGYEVALEYALTDVSVDAS